MGPTSCWLTTLPTFALACERLLTEPGLRKRLVSAAEELYLERYERSAARKRIQGLAREIATDAMDFDDRSQDPSVSPKLSYHRLAGIRLHCVNRPRPILHWRRADRRLSGTVRHLAWMGAIPPQTAGSVLSWRKPGRTRDAN